MANLALILSLLYLYVSGTTANSGKSFYQVFHYTHPNLEPLASHIVHISTDEANPCEVKITDTDGDNRGKKVSLEYKITVSAGKAVEFQIPRDIPSGYKTWPPSYPPNRGIKLEAQCDFVVHGVNFYKASTDGWLGIPAESLGNEYLVMNIPAGYNDPFQLSVVAVEEGTICDLTFPNGTVYKSHLKAIEADYMESDRDFTGTRISCNKQVSVFSGQRCGLFPNGCRACGHMVEQIPPKRTFGRNFVLAPISNRPCTKKPTCCQDAKHCSDCMEFYRVLAAEDGTILTRTGSISTETITLQAGEYRLIIIPQNEYSSLVSNKPVLVGQHAKGYQYQNTLQAPFFTIVPPVDRFKSRYLFMACLIKATYHLNVVVNTETADRLQLNGASFLGKGAGRNIPNTKWAAYEYIMNCKNDKSFVVEHTGKEPFGLLIWMETSVAGSYGYPAGMNFDTDAYYQCDCKKGKTTDAAWLSTCGSFCGVGTSSQISVTQTTPSNAPTPADVSSNNGKNTDKKDDVVDGNNGKGENGKDSKGSADNKTPSPSIGTSDQGTNKPGNWKGQTNGNDKQSAKPPGTDPGVTDSGKGDQGSKGNPNNQITDNADAKATSKPEDKNGKGSADSDKQAATASSAGTSGKDTGDRGGSQGLGNIDRGSDKEQPTGQPDTNDKKGNDGNSKTVDDKNAKGNNGRGNDGKSEVLVPTTPSAEGKDRGHSDNSKSGDNTGGKSDSVSSAAPSADKKDKKKDDNEKGDKENGDGNGRATAVSSSTSVPTTPKGDLKEDKNGNSGKDPKEANDSKAATPSASVPKGKEQGDNTDKNDNTQGTDKSNQGKDSGSDTKATPTAATAQVQTGDKNSNKDKEDNGKGNDQKIDQPNIAVTQPGQRKGQDQTATDSNAGKPEGPASNSEKSENTKPNGDKVDTKTLAPSAITTPTASPEIKDQNKDSVADNGKKESGKDKDAKTAPPVTADLPGERKGQDQNGSGTDGNTDSANVKEKDSATGENSKDKNSEKSNVEVKDNTNSKTSAPVATSSGKDTDNKDITNDKADTDKAKDKGDVKTDNGIGNDGRTITTKSITPVDTEKSGNEKTIREKSDNGIGNDSKGTVRNPTTDGFSTSGISNDASQSDAAKGNNGKSDNIKTENGDDSKSRLISSSASPTTTSTAKAVITAISTQSNAVDTKGKKPDTVDAGSTKTSAKVDVATQAPAPAKTKDNKG